MSPGNGERSPGQRERNAEQTSGVGTSMRRGDDNYQRLMAALDVEYVRQSFRRSWDREVKRLRRSLRGAA